MKEETVLKINFNLACGIGIGLMVGGLAGLIRGEVTSIIMGGIVIFLSYYLRAEQRVRESAEAAKAEAKPS